MMHDLSRRRFVQKSIGLCGLSIAPYAWSIGAQASPAGLSFLSLHTGERLQTGITPDTDFSPETLEPVNRVLRDHRSGDITTMDPDLLRALAKLQAEVGVAGPFHVISGYRSPKTNAKLRAAGHGVATKSLHMQGKAIDIRLPGCDLKTLRDAAKSLKCGGVGYYAKSNFVHVDTGRVRYW
jgi:uncharacterized protein YcbK (DUF882 family)